MEFAVFASHITTNGKDFYRYTTRLKKKDGGEQTVTVKFRRTCALPAGNECPMNIVVDRKDMNLAVKEDHDTDTDPNTGEITVVTKIRHTLWINAWKPGTPYVDHSLDDYDIG